MRDRSPSADIIVRDSLVSALRTRLDSDFIDPAITAFGARPASITNGVMAQTSFSAGGSVGGGTQVALRRDINGAVDAFIDANLTDTLVWIMRKNTALKVSMMVNSLGEPDALVANIGPDGGTLAGIPVITSQFVPATGSPTGDYVILVDAQSIWFADEGGFSLDFSHEASVAMEDAPSAAALTGSPGSVTSLSTTALVSLRQENLMGWRGERTVNWLRARPNAVVVIEPVNWGE
jgi:HK97 family phage major capsid protein